MFTRVGVVIAIVALLCMVLLVIPAQADETSGITVSGSAKVGGKPTIVEIPCVVSGDAELTADALVKYRDARKRAVAAIEALNIDGLSVESEGYAVKDFVDSSQQAAMMRGQGVVNAKQKVSVTEQLRITLKNVDKVDQAELMDTMLKVLDTARDSGLTLGDGTQRNYNTYPPQPGPALIHFKVADAGALREEAYKQALEDAKAKAQKLAELAGVKLGPIVSVRDTSQPGRSGPSGSHEPQVTVSSDELSSTVCSDIPLNLALTVQFEIAK